MNKRDNIGKTRSNLYINKLTGYDISWILRSLFSFL